MKDSATDNSRRGSDVEVLRLPGRGLAFGAFNQSGDLDGVLTCIGGRGNTVPAYLLDGGRFHVCSADRDLARRLAVHLFGPVLRVYGEGRWERTVDGTWLMKSFNISEFRILNDAPLSKVVERLRRVEGSGWKDFDSPLAEVRRLRGIDEVY